MSAKHRHKHAVTDCYPGRTVRSCACGAVMSETVKDRLFDVYFACEGRRIATVVARDAGHAKRKAPNPYRKYLGELWVWEVIDDTVACTCDPTTCTRHGGHE